MNKNRDGQVELVLENRQVLLIFFGIVALCGVFFSLGYIIGRNTFSAPTVVAQATPPTAEEEQKPSAMPPPAYLEQGQRPAGDLLDPSASATDLSFYERVEGETPQTALLPSDPFSDPSAGALAPPEQEGAITLQPPPGILVQVSALTRREDAEALVNLLKERKLPVLVTSSSTDPLFHVVVGPYTREQDAQEAKILLEQDGFRPIIKR